MVNGRCSCGDTKDPEHDYKHGGKHPVHGKWQEKATTDPDTITQWWRYRPNANIGIATGEASGIFALDVDPDNDGFETLEKLEGEHGALPATWAVETGSGGLHYYFQWPGFDLRNSAGKLGPGLDTRGNGGQVVAPPSVSGKGPYVSSKTPVIAEAPAWLLDMLRPAPPRPTAPAAPFVVESGSYDTYTEKALQDECDSIAGARDGEQNDTINVAAFNVGQLVGAGALSEGEAREALLSAARAGNHPEGRAVATIESGLTAGMAEPRNPWPPVPRVGQQMAPEVIKRGVYGSEAEAHAHFIEPPDPLGGAELPPPPAMVVHNVMPPGLAAFAEAVAAHLQVPVEAPALMQLAALSTAALGRAWVDGRNGWRQPLIVRTLTTLRSGERKSDTVRIVVVPIREAEDALWDQHEATMENAAIEREQLEILAEELKKKLRGNPTNEDVLLELKETRQRLARLPAEDANPPQLTVGDSTPEALAQLLADNDERLGMLLAEDSLFGQINGRYSGGLPNLAIYLSSYDEEPYRVNRIGRGAMRLKAPALAIGLLVQPHVLDAAARIPGARDSGLMGRWIFAAPRSLMGERSVDSPPLDPRLRAKWRETVAGILAMPSRPEPRLYLKLSDEAHVELRQLRADLEPLQKEVVGRYAHMTDWTGKLPGTALRVAGLYHLAQGYRDEQLVNGETMRWAVSLARWASTHAEYVHRSWRDVPTSEGVEWILKWIRAKQLSAFTRRDLAKSAGRLSWYSPQALDDALADLFKARWIASVSDVDSAGRQKTAGKFLVHPALKEGTRG
jgi:hypothetical protein